MGHLINPISIRLSVNSFWNSSWSNFNNFNYVNLYKNDFILFFYLNWFINKSKFLKSDILVSHYKVYKVSNKVYINLYYYDVSFETKDFKYQLIHLNKTRYF